MTKEKKKEELYCMAKRSATGRHLYSSEWLIVNKYTDIFPKDKEYRQYLTIGNSKLWITDDWVPIAYEELIDWNLEETKGELK